MFTSKGFDNVHITTTLNNHIGRNGRGMLLEYCRETMDATIVIDTKFHYHRQPRQQRQQWYLYSNLTHQVPNIVIDTVGFDLEFSGRFSNICLNDSQCRPDAFDQGRCVEPVWTIGCTTQCNNLFTPRMQPHVYNELCKYVFLISNYVFQFDDPQLDPRYMQR